jgi:hypothetical protein
MFKITSMAKHKAHNTGWMPKKLEKTISQSWSFGHNRQWADPSKGDVCSIMSLSLLYLGV